MMIDKLRTFVLAVVTLFGLVVACVPAALVLYVFVKLAWLCLMWVASQPW